MPWPLQVVFWLQIAGVVLSLVELFWTSHGRLGLADLGADVVVSALSVFLMLKLRSGHRWVRSVLTVVLTLTLLFAVLHMVRGSLPPVLMTVAAAATLALLYWPSSNAFFAIRAAAAPG